MFHLAYIGPPLTLHRQFMLTVVCSHLPKAHSEAGKTLNFVLSFYTAKKNFEFFKLTKF